MGRERRSMEQRVSLITLGVADLQRSRDFYESLGWKRVNAKADGIVFFQVGGMALALYPRIALAEDANVSPEGHGFSGITIAYNARTRGEVDAVLAQAKAAGAILLKPAQETFWGGTMGILPTRTGSCGKWRGTRSFRSPKMGVSEFLRKLSCPRAAVGLPETPVGSKPRNAAKAGTKGYAPVFRRAFDWQQRCRLR